MKGGIAIVLLTAGAVPASAQWYGGCMMNGWGGFMMLFWIAVLALVAWAVYVNTRRRGGGEARGGKALEILKERYAKGEITREEYQRMKKDLEE